MDLRDLVKLAGIVNPELLNKIETTAEVEEADAAGFDKATTRPDEEVMDDPMATMGSDADLSLRRYLKARGDHVTVDENVYPDYTVEDVNEAYAFFKEGKYKSDAQRKAVHAAKAVAEEVNTSGDYANVVYDYKEDFYMIDVYKDGEKVAEDNGYFGANETGNPLITVFLKLVKEAGLEAEGLRLVSTGGDEPDMNGVFKNGKFNWNKTEGSEVSDEEKERALRRAMQAADEPERGEKKKKVSLKKAPWEESVDEASIGAPDYNPAAGKYADNTVDRVVLGAEEGGIIVSVDGMPIGWAPTPEELAKMLKSAGVDDNTDIMASSSVDFASEAEFDDDDAAHEFIQNALEIMGIDESAKLPTNEGRFKDMYTELEELEPEIIRLKNVYIDKGMEPEEAQDMACEKLGCDPEMFDEYLTQKDLDEANVDENAFNQAAAAAARAGKDSFEFGGKTHKTTMKKDVAHKLDDDVDMLRKLAGLQVTEELSQAEAKKATLDLLVDIAKTSKQYKGEVTKDQVHYLGSLIHDFDAIYGIEEEKYSEIEKLFRTASKTNKADMAMIQPAYAQAKKLDDEIGGVMDEGRMSDQLIHDSETMSKEDFTKKYGKELADEYFESTESLDYIKKLAGL